MSGTRIQDISINVYIYIIFLFIRILRFKDLKGMQYGRHALFILFYYYYFLISQQSQALESCDQYFGFVKMCIINEVLVSQASELYISKSAKLDLYPSHFLLLI